MNTFVLRFTNTATLPRPRLLLLSFLNKLHLDNEIKPRKVPKIPWRHEGKYIKFPKIVQLYLNVFYNVTLSARARLELNVEDEHF